MTNERYCATVDTHFCYILPHNLCGLDAGYLFIKYIVQLTSVAEVRFSSVQRPLSLNLNLNQA